ncbi:MAG: aldehyde dehydrogenase family protein [Solirubrobacterales bacterium]|nr:aldehyde dehydrogenase family protein [Solirubrobacterales bacterium]
MSTRFEINRPAQIDGPSAAGSEYRALLSSVVSKDWRLLIGGQLTATRSGNRYPTENPATEDVIAEVPDAGAEDVDRAVAAAVTASAEWRRIPPRERAAYIRRAAAVLLEHEHELAFLDAVDSGNPITAMRMDVQLAATTMNLYADWSMELGGETIPLTSDHLHYTVREPYGVVARIIPYNHPILFAASRCAAPLIAGNAVVLKAPDQTPLSALRMGELLQDVFPPGVLSVITGRGPVAGKTLVENPSVRRIAFIGSVQTGRAIQKTAAEAGVKHVTLELGGKNPVIVFPDADLDRAAQAAVLGMNFHWTAGQSCGSTSRLLLHESIADEVIAKVNKGIEAIRVGDPLDPETQMGALVSREQYEKVLRYVELGHQAGARLLCGGGRPARLDPDRGYFVEPTVFLDVEPASALGQEEIFGPVLSVMRWADERQAVEIANGVPFGLTAGVWTNDLRTAHRMAAELEAGYLWINAASRHYWGAPYGGFKDSGVGREEGIDELLSFTQVKTVNMSTT